MTPWSCEVEFCTAVLSAAVALREHTMCNVWLLKDTHKGPTRHSSAQKRRVQWQLSYSNTLSAKNQDFVQHGSIAREMNWMRVVGRLLINLDDRSILKGNLQNYCIQGEVSMQEQAPYPQHRNPHSGSQCVAMFIMEGAMEEIVTDFLWFIVRWPISFFLCICHKHSYCQQSYMHRFKNGSHLHV